MKGRVLLPVSLCVLVVSCHRIDDIRERQRLNDLVERKASRSEVAQALGEHYDLYEKGTPSWADLERFLQREPSNTLVPLRENAKRYPKVMAYVSAWRVTWVFVDQNDSVQGYYMTAQ